VKARVREELAVWRVCWRVYHDPRLTFTRTTRILALTDIALVCVWRAFFPPREVWRTVYIKIKGISPLVMRKWR
jgi:hypothetical protein